MQAGRTTKEPDIKREKERMGDDDGHVDESREESGRRAGNPRVDIAPVCAIQRAAGERERD